MTFGRAGISYFFSSDVLISSCASRRTFLLRLFCKDLFLWMAESQLYALLFDSFLLVLRWRNVNITFSDASGVFFLPSRAAISLHQITSLDASRQSPFWCVSNYCSRWGSSRPFFSTPSRAPYLGHASHRTWGFVQARRTTDASLCSGSEHGLG